VGALTPWAVWWASGLFNAILRLLSGLLVGPVLRGLSVVVSFGRQRQSGENGVPAEIGHFRAVDLRALVGGLHPDLSGNPLVGLMGQRCDQKGAVTAGLRSLDDGEALFADGIFDRIEHVGQIGVCVLVASTASLAGDVRRLRFDDGFDLRAGLGAGGNELADLSGAVSIHHPARSGGQGRRGIGLEHGVRHG
jgi:hypothetical protein